LKDPAGNEPGAEALTAWSIFSRSPKYFSASEADFMVNYRVDDLEVLLDELKQAGVQLHAYASLTFNLLTARQTRASYACG
jgi:hypothetical protein